MCTVMFEHYIVSGGFYETLIVWKIIKQYKRLDIIIKGAKYHITSKTESVK